MALNKFKPRLKRHPARTVIYSFALADLIGALLLSLPFSHHTSLPFIDALFTSTSAVCVTGLTVVNVAKTFTRFGEWVILFLMQLGGLGVMTFSVLFILGFRGSLSLSSRLALQESFFSYGIPEIKVLLSTIFLFTFFSEGIIFLSLFFCFLYYRFNLFEALFQALFHAVSAFCNAGFSSLPQSLDLFKHSYALPIILMLAILLGNTGFPVVYELVSYLRKKRKRLSLHFRLTVGTHLLFILIGTLSLLWFERSGILAPLPWSLKITTALFHSISARTAGFSTYDMASFSEHSLYIFLALMVIGACPGSTGGALKTTTIGVLWFTAWSRLRGFSQTVALKRTIPENLVSKAITLMVLYLLAIMAFHFLLTLTEPNLPFRLSRRDFLSTLFETVSALGTVGLSTGITSHLNFWGKVCIIMAMFIGRVGLLSLVSFLTITTKEHRLYTYAKEEVMVG